MTNICCNFESTIYEQYTEAEIVCIYANTVQWFVTKFVCNWNFGYFYEKIWHDFFVFIKLVWFNLGFKIKLCYIATFIILLLIL